MYAVIKEGRAMIVKLDMHQLKRSEEGSIAWELHFHDVIHREGVLPHALHFEARLKIHNRQGHFSKRYDMTV